MNRIKAEENHLTRILLLYRDMIPSVRLCGHLQMLELAEQSKIEYRHITVSELTAEAMNWADIVILGRLDCSVEYEIARTLKKAGKYLIYILDDDLLNIPDGISSAPYYKNAEIQNSIRNMIRLSDAMFSPSKVLLNKYAVSPCKGILLEEPAVEIVEYHCKENGEPVKIGFAGSVDRVGDIESVLGTALMRIKEEYGKGVRFSFFGAIPAFAKELEAETIPYTDSYTEYRKKMNEAKWDIGLAPMLDTPFHCCKHYNKFIEYAAAGITGVFSLCGPYVRLRDEIGLGDFCANTSEEWYGTIKRLIDFKEVREKKKKGVLEYAQQKLTTAYLAERLYNENKDVFAYRAPKHPIREHRIYEFKIKQMIARIRILYRMHGVKLSLHIMKKVCEKTWSYIGYVFR